MAAEYRSIAPSSSATCRAPIEVRRRLRGRRGGELAHRDVQLVLHTDEEGAHIGLRRRERRLGRAEERPQLVERAERDGCAEDALPTRAPPLRPVSPRSPVRV